MDSALISVLLPLALAVVMLGLGLSLTVDDFRRIGRHPRAVVIALGCQLLLLPVICFGLVLAFDLDPLLAVGMMLLAASPGGTTANLFSHLFRGDVALNITLTAVNSVIAVVTLPIVTNLAFAYFDPQVDGEVGLQFGKVLQVFAIVLIPVVLGMLVRSRKAFFADRMDRPVRILSVVVLTAVILGTILAERDNVLGYLADVGVVAFLFCLASLGLGYAVPRALSVEPRQALASSMEIGVHNGTLAIAVAISVLGSVTLAVPAAVYSVIMFPTAAVVGFLISRVVHRTEGGRESLHV
ncbi:MAG: bile acid:sodium symporter family protein [Nocardioides sp.]|nr:bile acid:sodium symporter family protein [Nocardioides sp.]